MHAQEKPLTKIKHQNPRSKQAKRLSTKKIKRL